MRSVVSWAGMAQAPSSPRSVVIWHAETDLALCDKLAQHLDPLVKRGRITLWHPTLVQPGEHQSSEVEARVDEAQVLLVLVSAASLNQLHDSRPVQRALLRHQSGEVVVIPVLLRPALWDESPLSGLRPLPRDGRAVTLWEDLEAALRDVAHGVAELLRIPSGQRWRRVAAGSVLGASLIAGAVGLAWPTVELDIHEVTNADFAVWLNSRRVDVEEGRLVRDGEVLQLDLYRDASGGSGLRWENGRFETLEGMEQFPVVQVSYAAAERYCTEKGARLPLPREWLAAACGRWHGHFWARSYPWGNESPRCDGVVYGRHNGACQHLPQSAVAVGTATQDRTSQGLWDLGGNVAEWTAGREVRGGDYARGVTECRTLLRNVLPADAVRSNLGFRCAR